jgi:TetR/AcrR family transcriptional regulator, transcriptional repressor for nem operon
LSVTESPTRRRILHTAVRLFNLQGYNATGIADIQKAAKVKRGSLYFHFESKEALALEVLGEFFAGIGGALSQELSGPMPSPLDSLFRVFGAVRDQVVRDGYHGGCLLGTFSQEMAADNAEARRQMHAYFDKLLASVAVFFEASQQKGEMRKDLDARKEARLFVSAFHGALIELRVYRDEKVFDEVMDAVRSHYQQRRHS